MGRIIYQSKVAPALDRAALFRLVYHARVANEREGLSGFLLFADQRFLQVLEGPAWKLCATFAKIRRDVRHTGVEVIDERSISALTFQNWRMRSFHQADATAARAAMAIEAGKGADGSLPKVIDEAVQAFFPCDWAHPITHRRAL